MSSASPDARAHAWHALEAGAVLRSLGACESGLTGEEAAARLARHGPNRLPRPPSRSSWLRFAAQFDNVLIYVLLGAGVVTALLGQGVDAGVIFGVVLINAVIGFVQEGKAERALEAVRGMLSPRAFVSRDGRRMTIAAEELVPGDLVHLQPGDRVPADLRLVAVRELRIDEALLTGESLAVEKSIGAVAADAALGDRFCMAYSGTLVAVGQGAGVVVATAVDTEVGRISRLLAQVEPMTTPLLRKLAGFGRFLTVAILALASATFLFGIGVRGYAASEMFLAAVGLAVAAIPEGLPAIITITLAIGVQRMARRNAVVRRLPAVETLGSVTVICSDKTGTLTRNEMTVQSVVLDSGVVGVGGAGYEPHGSFVRAGTEVDPADDPVLDELLRAVVLCNEADAHATDEGWKIEGDPTEAALVVLGMKAGLDGHALGQRFPRTDVIPFESAHRFMASLHHDHEGHAIVYLKGAPEVLLSRCRAVRAVGGEAPLDVDAWHDRLEAVAAGGERPLAVASKSLAPARRAITYDDVESDLILLGLVGIADPPRDGAPEAVARCAAAGIRVKMITGDHAGTARAVAARVGIADGAGAMTGGQLDALDPAAMEEAAAESDVFARVSPETKLKIVIALQAAGEVVAMTGDGVNDAPALKRADVGVAMGLRGTEAAREAAEMVLADDDFATIAHAVEEGRTVYDNIRKSVLYILPTSFGEAFTIIAAVLLGHLLPVTAAQILWVNMVTTVTLALSLSFEPPERDVMRRPPRDPAAPMLDRFMWWRIVFVSLVMVSVTFGLFVWELEHDAPVEVARTVAVNTLVMLEVFYLFNTRFLDRGVLSLDGLFGSRYVLASIGVVLLLQALFTYAPPMALFFQTHPIDLASWLRIVAFASLVLFLVEIEKRLIRRRRP